MPFLGGLLEFPRKTNRYMVHLYWICVRACMCVCMDIDIRVYLCLSVFMPFLSGTQSCPATSLAESLTRNGGGAGEGGMPRTGLSSHSDCQNLPVPHSQEPTPTQALPRSLFTLTLDTTLTDLDGLSVETQQLGRKRK